MRSKEGNKDKKEKKKVNKATEIDVGVVVVVAPVVTSYIVTGAAIRK